jgi:azurin
MAQLEGFVLEQLTKELNEFHEDKRSLVEAKVKMIKEGKEVIEQTKRKFIESAAVKVEKVLESTIKNELTTLREDIQVAKENTFGRKIFETFAAEFMSSYLNEGTEVAKMNKAMGDLKSQLDEANKAVVEKEVQLTESTRKARIAEDKAERKLVMNEMMAPLSKQQKEIMGALLESTKTADLQNAFNKYLPSVLKEDAKPQTKKVLSESTKEVTGGKSTEAEVTVDANIVNLRKLAGIS